MVLSWIWILGIASVFDIQFNFEKVKSRKSKIIYTDTEQTTKEEMTHENSHPDTQLHNSKTKLGTHKTTKPPKRNETKPNNPKTQTQQNNRCRPRRHSRAKR